MNSSRLCATSLLQTIERRVNRVDPTRSCGAARLGLAQAIHLRDRAPRASVLVHRSLYDAFEERSALGSFTYLCSRPHARPGLSYLQSCSDSRTQVDTLETHMDAIETTRRLHEAGCRFVISVPTANGHQNMVITAEQAARLLEDPTSIWAEVNQLSVAEYAEWVSLNGAVLCRANTVTGRPCRNVVKGATFLPSQEWKALKESGGYCALHGG